jgi:hypothetical protein
MTFRARKAPVFRELGLHFAVAELLRNFCLWPLWSHFPAGEERNPIVGAKLKQMGTARGWADFILIGPDGRAHFLELKRPGGKLSEDQEIFQAHCLAYKIEHCVAHDIDEVLCVLGEWECLMVHRPRARLPYKDDD